MEIGKGLVRKQKATISPESGSPFGGFPPFFLLQVLQK